MSESTTEGAGETTPQGPSEGVPGAEPAPPSAGGRTFFALIPQSGRQPPGGLAEADAEAAWAAVSAVWHPALLATAAGLPVVEDVDAPSPPGPGEVRVMAPGGSGRLPSGYRTGAEDAGTALVDGLERRPDLVEELLARFAPGRPGGAGEALALDFLALGAAHWWLRDLTAAMTHGDALDHEGLRRETLAAARAWCEGDANSARNRLRAAFEVLTEARERVFPADAYIIDLCLLDPAAPAGALRGPLEARSAVTFIAPARAIEAQAAADPESLALLREAVTEGWADVTGGAYDEADEPLLPVESILWQFRRGGEVYREHLDGRNVEALARRRFALYPMLPQVARRFGFRFAVHLAFDAGKFPVRPEPKRLWEGPDHTSLETLLRPPMAADRASTGLAFPWRLAATMRHDHVATLPLVHWPSPVAGWFDDLRRVAGYSPVFARMVTLNDYFHLTDRPYESFSAGPDEYETPYLAQAVAAGRDPTPVSGRARHAALRARFDGCQTARAFAQALGADPADAEDLGPIEADVETGRHAEAAAALDTAGPRWAAALAAAVAGAGTAGRPGFLVLNPSGLARRATVVLPEAAADLRPEGPLRAAQLTEDGVVAVVDLPAFGFAWVPRDANFEASPASAGALTAKDHALRNETVSLEVDPATGGLRGVKAAGEDVARLGQQLVMTGLTTRDGQPGASRMVAESYEVEYAGPALAQGVSRGSIVGPDGRVAARFRQRFRLWTGRPVLEIDVDLEDVDPAWLRRLAKSDPWETHLACRWAWPDAGSMLRRCSLLAPGLTEAARPETPDALDVSTRRQRTAMIFGGLPYHRRNGPRMLDTLLVAGRETGRHFRLGVALDLEHPQHAAVEFLAPAFVVPTDAGPPPAGPAGWLARVDHPGVVVTAVHHDPAPEDGRGPALRFHLLETSGGAVRCRLRTFRDPLWARQTDFQGAILVDLPIDGDATSIDLTPHELARVEVTIG